MDHFGHTDNFIHFDQFNHLITKIMLMILITGQYYHSELQSLINVITDHSDDSDHCAFIDNY